MNDEKLEVGDKLFYIERFSKSMVIVTVERLTKTLAVLSDGKKVLLEPHRSGFSIDSPLDRYNVHGVKSTFDNSSYRIWTEQKESDHKAERAVEDFERDVNQWWNRYKFTQSQKIEIYNKYNEIL